MRVRKLRQAHIAREIDRLGPVLALHTDCRSGRRLLIAPDEGETRTIKAVITGGVDLIEIVTLGRRQMQLLNTGTAHMLKENLECSRDVLSLARPREVTLAGFGKRLEQRSIRIAPQPESKDPGRRRVGGSSVKRPYYLLQVSGSQGRIGIRDEDDTVFSFGKSVGHLDRFSESFSEIGAATKR